MGDIVVAWKIAIASKPAPTGDVTVPISLTDSATRQQHPGFHMMGPGELIEQRAVFDAVGIVQLRDIRRQRLRVAGDVQDIVEAPGQLASVRVHPGPRWVDEHTAELIAFQVYAVQAAERANLV